jgi:hypothetical protein
MKKYRLIDFIFMNANCWAKTDAVLTVGAQVLTYVLMVANSNAIERTIFI